MRILVLQLFAAVSLSATPAHPPQASNLSPEPSQQCRDRITEVREATGQPQLDRSLAVPGEGYLIAAVDKRIDGCAVMQMHRLIDDLRPLPDASSAPAHLIPLGKQ